MSKLSVALAVFNEEENIADCLLSVKDITDDIVIVDGSSTDKTVSIAKKFTDRIVITDNPPIFHINKQKAIDMAKHPWILQLDADERVSPNLAKEIMQVINLNENDLEDYQNRLANKNLFLRHQTLLQKRDGTIGREKGDYAAFFLPRLNFFLGRYLRYGGVYPDGVIRLIRKGKAYLPCKDVHEQMIVDGRVGWLAHDLYHKDSPTFSRYLKRNTRYVDLLAAELRTNKNIRNPSNAAKYLIYLPIQWFLLTYIRHKGFMDGFPGLIFSLFSALRFPRAYGRAIKK